MTKPFYHNKNFTLYQGNCLEIMQQFADNSFDMIFADPPYMLSNGGFSVQSGRRVCVNKGQWDKSNGFDEDFKFQNEWIAACKRILKPTGTIWISGTYHSIYQCGYALQRNGYHILNDIAWFMKGSVPSGIPHGSVSSTSDSRTSENSQGASSVTINETAMLRLRRRSPMLLPRIR